MTFQGTIVADKEIQRQHRHRIVLVEIGRHKTGRMIRAVIGFGDSHYTQHAGRTSVTAIAEGTMTIREILTAAFVQGVEWILIEKCRSRDRRNEVQSRMIIRYKEIKAAQIIGGVTQSNIDVRVLTLYYIVNLNYRDPLSTGYRQHCLRSHFQ